MYWYHFMKSYRWTCKRSDADNNMLNAILIFQQVRSDFCRQELLVLLKYYSDNSLLLSEYYVSTSIADLPASDLLDVSVLQKVMGKTESMIYGKLLYIDI